ncbi:MAG: hypothetical protein ACYDC1_16570 [Limisphaerales bacterium]
MNCRSGRRHDFRGLLDLERHRRRGEGQRGGILAGDHGRGERLGHKVGFHGVTPVAQAAHIPDPAGGTTVDAEARAAINAILLALAGKGIVAGS